ncbi:MAG: NADH-quinone oxidoreductase subunit H [Acidobacteriota bacterium]
MEFVIPFVNAFVLLLLSPLGEGCLRRLAARLQSRQGPPLTQPYWDLLKLLGKENLEPGVRAFRWAPVLAFSAVLAAGMLLPQGFRVSAFARHVDVVTLIYLLALGGVAVLLGAFSSRNIFAAVGAGREMVTMMLLEPVLAMILLVGAVRAGGLGLDAVFSAFADENWSPALLLAVAVNLAALQAFVGRQPFDLAEAESELAEGPFIEYSGPSYALFRWYLMMKQLLYSWLLVSVALTPLASGSWPADLALHWLAVAAVYALIGLVSFTNPRLRIDQAVRFYAALAVAGLAAVALSALGW